MSIFSGFFRQAGHQATMVLLRDQLRPAYVRHTTVCERCGFCCTQRPPRLTADDLNRLAARDGMTPSEFFMKFCVVDDPCGAMAPVLRRHHQEQYAGHYLPSDETFSIETPCIYHADNGCKVHDAKPKECADHRCWEQLNHPPFRAWTREELMAVGWDGSDGDGFDEDDGEW